MSQLDHFRASGPQPQCPLYPGEPIISLIAWVR
jgi:hypothetical protein